MLSSSHPSGLPALWALYPHAPLWLLLLMSVRGVDECALLECSLPPLWCMAAHITSGASTHAACVR